MSTSKLLTGKIYCRLSKDKKDQTSTADQERKVRAHLNMLGIPDERITVYVEDPGTSGYKDDVDLPERDKFIADPADVGGVWMHDRLSRRGIEDSFRAKRLMEEQGQRYVAVADGIDTLQEGNDIHLAMRAIMANQYSKTISKNVKRGKETGAANGIWNGGPRWWYGYATDSDGVWRGPKRLDDAEVKVLHEVRDRYVKGETMGRITRDLNDRGIPTSTGKAWKMENLLRLLLNKRYIGVRTHNGTEYPGNWPAAFTPEQRADIEAAKHHADRMQHWPNSPTGARTYLLSGMLTCMCGGKLRGAGKVKRGKFVRLYRCSTCKHSMRIADPLEHFITEAVLFRLDSPELGRLLTAKGDDNKLAEIVGVKQQHVNKLDRLIDAYQDGLLTKAQFTTRKTAVEADIQAAESRLHREMSQRTNLHLNVGETLRSAFETRGLDWQRRLIGLVINDVLVKPTDAHMKNSELYAGRWRFKPADVRINWIV